MDNGVQISLKDKFVPPDSDIQIKVDFNEGEGSPARVFEIAADLIRSFEDLDRVLISSVDSKITTTLILEDVKKSSLKVFLKNVLEASDDQALKELDWKPQVGKYLVKAKYIALEWLDKKTDKDEPRKIEDLTEKLSQLAQETDVRHLPDYPPINPTRLAQPLDGIQRTKKKFREGEKLTITLDESEYTVDLNSDWLPSELIGDEQSELQLSNDADMALIIRKPDFLGESQWQFRHGKTPFNAPIIDNDWLSEFHNGDHPLKPGDALRVRVRFEYNYDSTGNLIEKKETIIKVYSVIPAGKTSNGFFDDE